MFLLEERDLLSQQLAAEASATPGARGFGGGTPNRTISPVPFVTPATPSPGAPPLFPGLSGWDELSG